MFVELKRKLRNTLLFIVKINMRTNTIYGKRRELAGNRT
jgi:hypothetical protein